MERSNSTLSSVAVHQALICVVFTLIFLVGMLGNALVIWIILCNVKQRFPTVMLILNLAAADFTLLITLPFWIYSFATSWVFGAPFCMFLLYVAHCTMFASVFFIAAMSIERFVAVLYPFTAQNWWRRGAIGRVIIAVWVSAFLLAVPVITKQKTTHAKRPNCLQLHASYRQQKGLIIFETLGGFIIPFLILSVCNALISKRIKQMTFQSKNKSAKVIRNVMVVFAVCWLPYHIRNLLTLSSMWTRTSSPEISKMLLNISERLDNFVGAMATTNSCINPILYVFATRRFQNRFKTSGIAKLFQQLNIYFMDKCSDESNSVRDNSQKSIS
ncbi:leukotriene B4 receptor 1-like [Heterodontus francisci]|uniref:leukotriene B4 receptor 1-like n=1 Tax=Heterodontus francisci TaxID=7792 RepID=UPI00355AE5EB